MNHIYRHVWNKKRHMLMAVAEVGSANGKDAAGTTRTDGNATDLDGGYSGALTILAAALMALFPIISFAQQGSPAYIPAGESVSVYDSDGTNAAFADFNLTNDGTLDITGTNAGTSLVSLSGSGAVLMDARTLTLTAADGFYQGTLLGSGSLVIAGGYETLGGVNLHAGATQVDWYAGLALSGSGSIALSSGLLNNGVFDIGTTDNGAQVRSLSGSGSVLLGGQSLTLTNARDTFAGVIDGAGGLNVAGGAEVLSGANTYTGVTSIDQNGALALSGSGSIALSSGLANNGVFDIAATNNGAEVRSLSGSGTVLLGGQTLTLTNAGDMFAGSLQGSGGLAVNAGYEVLSGTNTYNGVTTVDRNGVLALSGSGSIALSSGLANDGVFDIATTNNGAEVRTLSGSGTVWLGGQTLTLTNAGDTFVGVIDGAGGLNVAGGAEVLSGSNTYTGVTSIDQNGALALSGSGSIALSSGLANNGVFDIAATNNGAEVRSLSGSGTVLLGDQTLTLTNAGDIFAGSIQGSGGLAVNAGYEVLSGANTYTGATNVDRNGVLALSGSGSIALSSGLANNGVFDIAATSNGAEVRTLSGSGAVLLGGQTLTLTNAGDTFAGVIDGAGGVNVAGGAEVLSGANTYTGATAIAQDGSLALSGSGSIALSSGLANNGVFDIAATSNGAEVRSLSGSGAVLLGGQTLTLSGANDTFAGNIQGSGGLTIAGGTEVLSGTNTYTGATTIAQNGALALSGPGSIALSSGLANNGVFDIAATNNGAEVRSLSGSGTVLLGGQTLSLTNAGDTFAGVIDGAGGLNVTGGAEVLSGTNTYTGATAIAQDSALALSGTGSIALSSGLANNGVFDIAATNNGAEVRSLSGSGTVLLGGQTLSLTNAGDIFAGVIDGPGGLNVTGGAEVLSGTNTYTGATTIAQNGSLALSGSGSIALSSGLANNGVFDIAATSNGAEVRSLSGSGAVLLGGQSLTLTNAGDTFAGSIHGSGGLAIAAGTEVLTGTNTYTGATAIAQDGSLALSGSGSIALSSGLANNGVFDIAATSNGAEVRSLSGSGVVLLGGQSLTLTNAGDMFAGSIQGSGGLAIAAGSEVLTGTNTYTGTTTIAHDATLALAGNGSIDNSRVQADGTLDVSASAGNATVKSLGGSGGVLLGGQTLTLSGANDTFAGSIHGSGGLAIAAGTEILSGTNTYTGATTIAQDGSLALSGTGSIVLSSGLANNGVFDIAATNNGAEVRSLSGSGAVLLGGQSLTLTNAGDTFAGSIHGSGGLTIAAGSEVLTGTNAYTGVTTIAQDATLALAGNGSIDNSRVQADGTLDVSASAGNATVKSLGGSGAVLLGGQTLTLSGANDTFAGSIQGSGGLAIAAGSEVLTGTNTYTGATTIAQDSALALSGTGSIALSSGLANNGVFDIAATNNGAEVRSLSGSGAVLLGGQSLTLTNAGDTFAGSIHGSGGLTIAAGSEVLTGTNTYTGATTIAQDGSLALSGSGSIALSSGLANNGVFDIAATSNGAEVRTLSGSGAVLLGGQSLTLTNAGDTFVGSIHGSGGLTIAAGTEILSGTNTYTGATTIAQDATLALAGSGSIALSSGLDNDGVFDIAATNNGAEVRSLSGSGTVLLGGQTLSLTNAGDTFAGVIDGAGGLNVTGGAEVLSGTNAYSGATTIAQDGSLALSGSGSIALSSGLANNGVFDIAATNNGTEVRSLSGSGAVLLGGQSLTLTNAGDTFAGSIQGSGGLTIAAGSEVLTGTNTYTGATTIAHNATLALAGNGSIDNSRVQADGTLDVSASAGNATVKSLGGSGGVLLGGQTLALSGANDTFAGNIHGSGGLAIAAGTEVLSGTNTYTGATTIAQDSALALSGTGSIALSSGLANNGVFDIAATNNGAEVRSLSGSGAVLLGGQSLTLTNAGDTFAGSIHGSGGLTIAAGSEVLTGTNTYTGATTIAHDATLALAGNGSIDNSRVQADGTLDVSASAGNATVKSLGGSGAVLLGGQTLTLSGANDTFAGSIQGSGGLAIAAGSEVLTGTNTYTGATTIAHDATLALAGNGSIDNSRVQADGTLDVSASAGNATFKSLGGSGSVLLGGQTLTLSGANDTFAGNIHGSGGLAIAGGTEVLSGTNTYTGATTIAQDATLALAGNGSIDNSRVQADGTLDVSASAGNAAVKGLSGSGAILLGGQTLTLTNAQDVFAGSIRGSGGVAIAAGTETLTGTNTYTGATTIAHEGSLTLSGSGSIALSSGLANNGVFDITATNHGAEVRTLSGSGAVLLGGRTLTLTNAQDVFAGGIHGSGGVSIAAGTETLTGTNTYSGTTTVAHDATLALTGAGSIGNSRVQTDGTLDVSASTGGAAVKSLGGSGAVLLGGQTLTLTDAAGTFDGRISGSGGIAIAGGVQTLTTTQGYTGATSVGQGATLTLAGNELISDSSKVVADGTLNLASAGATIKSLAGAGQVHLGGQTLTLSAAGDVFAGTIDGSGSLDLVSGTETLAGTNTYSGSTSIGSGATLALVGQGRIASSSGVHVAGTFDISGTTSGATVRSVSGGGSINLGAQTLALSRASGTFAGTILGAGGLSVAGGSVTLSGINKYTGTTSIAGGASLALSGKGSIAGSAVRDDGEFDVSGAAGNVAIKGLSGSGRVLLGANDLTITAADGRFTGIIDGNGSLKLTGGKLTLGGANSYTGKTVVSGGTLQTYADANLGKGSAALELDNGTWQTSADLTHERGLLLAGRGTVDVDGGTVTTEGGAVTGSGALVKEGSGTLILRGVLANGGGLQVERGTLALSAANTYTGDTTVSKDGLLRIDRDANLGAASNKLVLDGGTLQTTGTMTSARTISITAQNGVLDAEGADNVVTLNGNISGDGRMVKEGQGTLVLGGDNGGGQGSANKPGDGWTGGLTINDGLVKVTNAYGLGWGSVMTFNAGTIYATVDIATGQDIRMGRSTNINTEVNTTTTLAGDLLSTGAGNGCFTKTGLGTLNVTGNANIDATCVMEGKLLANGVFSSKVTVAHGAMLGGSGTIKGDLLVQGTLSPGNSPGMLTADSNITMATGSTYKEDIGGTVQATAASPVGAPGYYSYLHVVNGKRFVIEQGSSLAPTLKNLYSADESGYGSAPLTPQLGQSFRIVTADGGIVGRFDTLVQPDGMNGTRMAAFYNVGNNNSIELKVLPASYAGWLKGGNANSSAVAGALDRIVDLDQSGRASAQQDALLYQVGSASADKLGGLVQGLSGEVHGALAAAAPQAGWNLQRSVLKHAAGDGDRALWLDLAANRGKWSGDADASGFQADRMQVTAGLDVLRGAGFRLGFGASYAHTDVSAADGSGKLRQNKVFVYGETTVDGLTFDGIGSIGRDKADSRRADPLASSAALSGRADGNGSLLGIGVRGEREFFGAKVEPFARVTVQKIRRDGLTETPASAAALVLDGSSATGTRLQAGLSAASNNADPLVASTYRFNLGAGVDAGGLLRPAQAASLAGENIAIGAPGVGRAFVQGGVTGTLQLKKGAYLYYGVTGEARSGYYQVGGNAGVRAVF